MASVQVTIAGRAYRMACGDGEEKHLEALAAAFDAKISEMRSAFGEIGDMRLHVMAAIMTADELSEARRRVETLEAELSAMRSLATSSADRSERMERQLTEALNRSAGKIEALAARFRPGSEP
ncbi:cell division protein ZapA [Enterovirga rhinocerotis]|uniref:Cell division protein ZapA n=1 Tax=Enterovirga rhinocerotis TaxID=1339210 RepID=A0A4R7BUV8_9HYPH|nr:cell division protein ZapA [Enterovirga rhinocerotis]TDR87977.1 cell division protein ZapA [Enterovirga rhinocerotis]